MNLENTQRTVWQLTDRVEFFKKMRPVLNITDEEADEIITQLGDRNFDYLEIAAYFSKNEDPDAALVFDGKKDIFWDIFNKKKSKLIIGKLVKLAEPISKIDCKIGLTQRDWRKRFEAISGPRPF